MEITKKQNRHFLKDYTVPKLFSPKVELGGHSILVSTLETDTLFDDIYQIKVTGRLIVPHDLDCCNIEEIEEISSGSCFDNGVTAQIWNVKTKVDAGNIITIDLDALQNALHGSQEKSKDCDYRCRSYSDLDLAHLESLVQLLAGEN
ncbi:hypothetical protein [Terasakiella sp. SH-1]|uniref:hypothetical protein n=1 Tax=Terasakiella sp. SH-1 TaxID=2560057 RepID=UPI001073BC0F|nr:hypothetical protein [Terasakiella sp. SH-1]